MVVAFDSNSSLTKCVSLNSSIACSFSLLSSDVSSMSNACLSMVSNALTIDFLFKEWNNKVAGFVSYGGGALGTRAVEQLRLVMAELQVATVRNQVQLSLFTDFENFSIFKPAHFEENYVNSMLDQVIAWGSALRILRTGK